VTWDFHGVADEDFPS